MSLRLDGVGALQLSDLRATFERRSAYYSDALLLARHVIHSAGRTFEEGGQQSWAFLIRTPEAVEQGVRVALMEALGPAVRLEKRGVGLPPTSLTMSPDLLFNDGVAVGDVKYRLGGSRWRRDDLYQAEAFATAFNARFASVVSFATQDAEAAPPLAVGRVRLANFNWVCSETTPPPHAAGLLANEVQSWVSTMDTLEPLPGAVTRGRRRYAT